MKETGMVLSGSAALEIVQPGSCRPQDLDFYCPCDKLAQVMTFFVTVCGFVDETTAKDLADYSGLGTGVKTVKTLRHGEFPALKINVVQSSTASPHVPILFFHSTIVMNFVSNDGIAQLYPALTSRKRGQCCSGCERRLLTVSLGLINRVRRRLHRQNHAAILKYLERGFQLEDLCAYRGLYHAHNNLSAFECYAQIRKGDDGHACTLPFEEESQVVIAPRVVWKLGTAGDPCSVMVEVNDVWLRLKEGI